MMPACSRVSLFGLLYRGGKSSKRKHRKVKFVNYPIKLIPWFIATKNQGIFLALKPLCFLIWFGGKRVEQEQDLI